MWGLGQLPMAAGCTGSCGRSQRGQAAPVCAVRKSAKALQALQALCLAFALRVCLMRMPYHYMASYGRNRASCSATAICGFGIVLKISFLICLLRGAQELYSCIWLRVSKYP